MSTNTFKLDDVEIIWLGHSAVKIKTADKVIYIDPYDIHETEKADLILITHDHYDHCSPDDLKKIKKDSTEIVCAEACEGKIEGNIKTVKPNQKIDAAGIKIETVDSYNVEKEFHTADENFVGFIVNINGKRIYHAGDTDLIPEMNALENIDVALLPIGGKFTMDASEAAQAANIIQPQVAIPIHYGKIVGTVEDAKIFKKECEMPVELLQA